MKLLIALALATSLAPQDLPNAPAPRLRAIAFDSHSWGRPVSEWTVDAQGNGTLTVPEPGIYDAKTLVTRRFAAGTAGFRKLRVLLARAELRIGARECSPSITDQIYGSISWTRTTGRVVQFAFNKGCSDAASRLVLGDLAKAEALVTEWAAAGRMVTTREVKP